MSLLRLFKLNVHLKKICVLTQIKAHKKHVDIGFLMARKGFFRRIYLNANNILRKFDLFIFLNTSLR